MTDKRLDELTENTSPADADLMYQVDASDTTDSAQGTSKKLTFANMKTWLQTAFNSVYAALVHTHTESDITDLGSYAAASHTHTASDIDSEASTDGHVLTSDGAGNAAWEAVAGGGGALGDLSDVTLTSPASDEVLSYNGSAWVNAAAAGGGSSSTTGWVLLDTIENATAGDFDFTSIPAGYEKIRIEGNIRCAAANTGTAVDVYLNDDTTATNYWNQYHAANAGSNSSPSLGNATLGVATSGNSPSGAYTYIGIEMRGYDQAQLQHMRTRLDGYRTTSNIYTAKNSIVWEDGGDTVVDQITVTASGGMTGKLYLYGYRSLTIEDSNTVLTKVEVPVTLNAGGYDIDLSGHQDAVKLVIEGNINSDAAGFSEDLLLEYNGDTSNYYYQADYGNATTPGAIAGATARIGGVNAGSYPTTRPSTFRADILDFGSASNWTICKAHGNYEVGTGNPQVWINSIHQYQQTAAVTSARISGAAGNLTGTVTAYVEKPGVIASTPLTSSGPTEVPVTESGGDLVVDLTGHQDKTRVVLKGEIKSSISGVDTLDAWINDDTTATNYATQLHQVVGATHQPYTGVNESTPGYCPGTAATNEYASITWVIENYARTDNVKVIQLTGNSAEGTTSIRHYTGAVKRKTSTDAVTKIAISGSGNITGNIKCYVED